MRNRIPLATSIVALVVAVLGSTPLGKAAYTAITPGSIGVAELRNGSVTNPKLRGDAVTSGKVLNGSLRLVDFKANQIPAGPAGPSGDKGDKGSKGDRGEKGVKGDTGDKGAAGISGYEVVQGATVQLAANGTAIATARCPAGKKVIGGGGSHASAVGFIASLGQSLPANNTNNTVWQVAFKNTSGSQTASVYPYAVCAVVG